MSEKVTEHQLRLGDAARGARLDRALALALPELSRSRIQQLLAEGTRISSKHMDNIEADRYEALPATVYLRGMLMSVARELGLDPLRVCRSYMGLVASAEKKRR